MAKPALEEIKKELQTERKRRSKKRARRHRNRVALYETILPASSKLNRRRRRWLSRNLKTVMAEFHRREIERLELERTERRNRQATRYERIRLKRAS